MMYRPPAWSSRAHEFGPLVAESNSRDALPLPFTPQAQTSALSIRVSAVRASLIWTVTIRCPYVGFGRKSTPAGIPLTQR